MSYGTIPAFPAILFEEDDTSAASGIMSLSASILAIGLLCDDILS